MRRSVPDACRACASVLATMNSGPVRPAAIMLLTALPPAPPTPMTTMRGFMVLRLSEALAKPLPHTPQVPACNQTATAPARARGRVESDMHETDRGRVLRSGKAGDEPADRLVRRHPHTAREIVGRQLAQSRLLARSARQHHAPGVGGDARTLDTLGNLGEQAEHAVPDDGADLSLGCPCTRTGLAVASGVRELHAVVAGVPGQGRMMPFDSFRFVNGRRESLRDVASRVIAADRHH